MTPECVGRQSANLRGNFAFIPEIRRDMFARHCIYRPIGRSIMTNNLLIKQRQQFVRFMRARGVAFDEIVNMLRGIGNPVPFDTTEREVVSGGLLESRSRLRQRAKSSR